MYIVMVCAYFVVYMEMGAGSYLTGSFNPILYMTNFIFA